MDHNKNLASAKGIVPTIYVYVCVCMLFCMCTS